MSPLLVLALYCGLIILASLLGGVIPMMVRLTHRRMEIAVSGVAGVMLGIGLLHLLPHAFTAAIASGGDGHGSVVMDEAMAHHVMGPLMLWLLAGFLVMFFIERFFCFHHHDAPAAAGDEAKSHADHDHGHDCGHDHNHDHAHAGHHHASSKHRLTWAGAGIGLSLHSLIEGVALAASIEAGGTHGAWAAGLGTFLVIALHKPFDSMTLGALMHLGDRSTRLRHVINFLFALLVPVGAMLFHLGMGSSQGHAEGTVVAAALAFSAGTFLCIATSDLLPELQFHSHDRGKLSAALLLGLAIAWGISRLEASMHGHDHGEGAMEAHDHDHDHDHDH